jgi:pyruvate/2-oxoglutarate dehydrogenase complex dihydrolipoamide dehydrogenase (E3) component
MPEHIRADLCVLGGGSGGLSVAAGAVQMGASVVLLEPGPMGGDCLNFGCVPSKALIASGRHAHAMTAGGAFGVTPVAPEVDFAAARDHVARVIAGIAPHYSVERFEGLGVRVIRAAGRFVSPREVAAGDAVVAARRFVIATGSRPVVPRIPGLDTVRHYTNEDIFELRERPAHLLVIGGGPVGLELAQAHRRLGCRVTVLEAARALGSEDPELAAVVLDRLRAEGIEIVEGVSAAAVEAAGPGVAVASADGRSIEASHLLLAVGRRAATDGLSLYAAGVRATDRGVTVDAGLRSSNRRVYAIGDAAGGPMFTHAAGYHASVMLRSALFGLPARASQAIPRVTYTDPELAQVGPTEAEARALHGRRLEVLRFSYAENDRARTEHETEGLIKVMVVGGRPVGAGIVGAQAGELIGLWVLAISSRLKISAVAGMVAPYPTLTEISKRAAGQYYVPRLFESAVVRRFVRFVQRLG